jgi:hypothetical protein
MLIYTRGAIKKIFEKNIERSKININFEAISVKNEKN